MKVTAIIQARMTSSRLPGKILMPVLGKPLLQYMIERVQRASCIDSIVLATTLNKEDDPSAELGNKLGVEVFRGAEDDVLDRFFKAAQQYGGKHIMRLTGDCPIIDPDLLDNLATFYFSGGYDYATNCLEPTLPDGLDAEIISMNALKEVHDKAIRPSHREHVTLYVRDTPDDFKIGSWKNSTDNSHLRWTVDNREDFELIKILLEQLYPYNPLFNMQDMIELLQNKPEIIATNAHISRNEGLIKSLADEKKPYDAK